MKLKLSSWRWLAYTGVGVMALPNVVDVVSHIRSQTGYSYHNVISNDIANVVTIGIIALGIRYIFRLAAERNRLLDEKISLMREINHLLENLQGVEHGWANRTNN